MLILKKYGTLFGILLVLAVIFYVFKIGQGSCVGQYESKMNEIAQAQAKLDQQKLDHVLQVEQWLLDTDKEIQIKYRDRTKVVTKTVVEYIEKNKLKECRIGEQNMNMINDALRGESE